MAYRPIASKSFGVDPATGLEKQLHVIMQSNNALTETIEVTYDIVLLSPTGLVVQIVKRESYTRQNMKNNMKFDELRASAIGQGIEALVANDLLMINSFETIQDDLRQSVIPDPEPESEEEEETQD